MEKEEERRIHLKTKDSSDRICLQLQIKPTVDMQYYTSNPSFEKHKIYFQIHHLKNIFKKIYKSSLTVLNRCKNNNAKKSITYFDSGNVQVQTVRYKIKQF